MIRLIRSIPHEDREGTIWMRLAVLNADREAVTLVISAETDNPNRYIIDNAAALETQILTEGEIDERLTSRMRARDAKRLLKQSVLEGKTLAQVETYIDTNVTNLATAKVVMREMASQIWILYQVVEFLMED